MKRFPLILAALLSSASLLFLSGCSRDGTTVDTSQVESEFSGAEPDLKGSVSNIVSAVKSQDWSGASEGLRKLASNAKLTPQQKSSLSNLWSDVRTRVTVAVEDAKVAADKAMKNASEAADKAVKDLGDKLKK